MSTTIAQYPMACYIADKLDEKADLGKITSPFKKEELPKIPSLVELALNKIKDNADPKEFKNLPEDFQVTLLKDAKSFREWVDYSAHCTSEAVNRSIEHIEPRVKNREKFFRKTFNKVFAQLDKQEVEELINKARESDGLTLETNISRMQEIATRAAWIAYKVINHWSFKLAVVAVTAILTYRVIKIIRDYGMLKWVPVAIALIYKFTPPRALQIAKKVYNLRGLIASVSILIGVVGRRFPLIHRSTNVICKVALLPSRISWAIFTLPIRVALKTSSSAYSLVNKSVHIAQIAGNYLDIKRVERGVRLAEERWIAECKQLAACA